MHPADLHGTGKFGMFGRVQRCELREKRSEASCDRGAVVKLDPECWLGLACDAPPGKSSLGLTRHMAEMKPLLSASARIAVYAGCPCDRNHERSGGVFELSNRRSMTRSVHDKTVRTRKASTQRCMPQNDSEHKPSEAKC